MMLIQNGNTISGTFITNTQDVDLTKVKPDSPIFNYTADNFNNPQAFGDVGNIQTGDFITGSKAHLYLMQLMYSAER